MDETCMKEIHLTDDWGKAGKRKCGRKATHIYSNLPMCEHHYNKCTKHNSTNN